MGKKWDSDKGGRDKWIAWLTEGMKECLRVLKPGGMALVWCIPRTAHWTATAIEDAGFEIRDKIYHIQGQGFKKGLDISKSIDKAKGAEREIIGSVIGKGGQNLNQLSRVGKGDADEAKGCGAYGQGAKQVNIDIPLTVPATPEAQRFAGYGTGLKPSVEEWVLAMKPLDGTFAKNALKHGVAGLNIDGGRITGPEPHHNYGRASGEKSFVGKGPVSITPSQGRWPSNLLLSHHPECREIGMKKVKGAGWRDTDAQRSQSIFLGEMNETGKHYADPDGTETVPAYECAAGCPCGHVWATKELTECPECGCRLTEWICAVKMLDLQSGESKSNVRKGQKGSSGLYEGGFGDGAIGGFTDSGGASRFFYTSKASRSEREQGLKGHIPCVKCGGLDTIHHINDKGEKIKCVRNDHPTRKPIAIMEYLVRLTQTPDGGVVLDPFMGSGTTGIACVRTGREFIGVDNDPRYVEISRLAMEAARKKRRKGFNLV